MLPSFTSVTFEAHDDVATGIINWITATMIHFKRIYEELWQHELLILFFDFMLIPKIVPSFDTNCRFTVGSDVVIFFLFLYRVSVGSRFYLKG